MKVGLRGWALTKTSFYAFPLCVEATHNVFVMHSELPSCFTVAHDSADCSCFRDVKTSSSLPAASLTDWLSD